MPSPDSSADSNVAARSDWFTMTDVGNDSALPVRTNSAAAAGNDSGVCQEVGDPGDLASWFDLVNTERAELQTRESIDWFDSTSGTPRGKADTLSVGGSYPRQRPHLTRTPTNARPRRFRRPPSTVLLILSFCTVWLTAGLIVLQAPELQAWAIPAAVTGTLLLAGPPIVLRISITPPKFVRARSSMRHHQQGEPSAGSNCGPIVPASRDASSSGRVTNSIDIANWAEGERPARTPAEAYPLSRLSPPGFTFGRPPLTKTPQRPSTT